MANPLQERIQLLTVGEAQGKLRPEHKAELERYRAQGLAPAPGGGPQGDAVERRNAAKQLATYGPGVDTAHAALRALDEFDQINDRLRPTGGFINHASNAVRSWFGNSDLARMEQLGKGFARTQRKPGEGATSDFEGKMYNLMVGGADQPYATNRSFSQAYRREAQETVAKQQFREQYLSQRGTLLGADAAWDAHKRQAALPKPKPAAKGWAIQQVQ